MNKEIFDVVIYGATSAGVAAAIQAARMNCSVALIEPSSRIGGMTSGGLGATDIGNKAAIGGISREFYARVKAHYELAASWRWQRPEEYAKPVVDTDAMWTFEPAAALSIYTAWLGEHRVGLFTQERLDLRQGVDKDGTGISRIRMESGREFRGRMFIDASYEGDVMALAGVPYRVGREAQAEFDENLAGNRTALAHFHNLRPGVDPYRHRGDPNSGLLPGIEAGGAGEEGAGDARVQAYCYRMCLTDHPDNRLPFVRPQDYDEAQYELLLRNFEAGEFITPWANIRMPNRKTDTNNRLGVSTDFIGQNYAYPEAGHAEREAIAQRHRSYQQGLLWTLANHPRVPAAIRAKVSAFGTCRDEFTQGQGWQQQLYVREARRMQGAYVMTQHDCQGRKRAEDAVGLAAYTIDSHHVRRYVDASGHVRNEGDVQVAGFPPYPVAYGALTPRREHCGNLLVPVCLSATHAAYGSIRMEPVFMVLGQSAATAAALAIEAGGTVQDVDYQDLRRHLLAGRQVLEWRPA